MHILFLTDNFPPEVNAPASRTFEHCREWVRRGHRVTVITCAPNFPNGVVHEGYKNRLWSRETIEGIDVVRVWTVISSNAGFFWRVIDYASFMISALPAGVFTKRVDVVIATSPQLFTPCAGLTIARLKRRPFVFELRDLWPESIRAVGAMRQSRILDALERLELFLYRHSDHIVCVTNAFKLNLISRGVPDPKLSVAMNGADLSLFTPQPRNEDLANRLGLGGRIVVGYFGTLGMAHGLETVLEAARRLQLHPDGQNIRILLLGDGAEKQNLKAQSAALGLTNVVFVDSVPRHQVVTYWSIADIALIHLKKRKLFETVIPSKLFECMAMGIPVLHGVAGESAEIVKQENCGVLFEAENADELASSILHLSANRDQRAALGRNGAAAAKRHDRIAIAHRLLETLLTVCRGHRARPDAKAQHSPSPP